MLLEISINITQHLRRHSHDEQHSAAAS